MMNKVLFGIDIGGSSVKLAYFAGSTLKKAAMAPLPDNMVADGRILSMDAMADFLRQAARDNGIPLTNAAVVLPFGSAQPEVERTPIMHNTFYLALAPEHPLYPRESLQLADLAGQRVYYEPLYQEIVDYAGVQPGMPFSTMEWRSVENYAHVYTELLAGRGMFLFPMRYPAYPAAWYRQVWLPLPDTVLLTLRDDPRPEIATLRRVFTEVYGERIKALIP